jgi:coproporphyrinogen III oxidase-like Fe-S oxidoreductase
MLAGVDPTELREETGYDMIALLDDVIAPLVKQRLLEWSHGKLRLTRRGLLVSDAIWPKFLRR